MAKRGRPAKVKTEGAKLQAVNGDVLVQLVKSKAENKQKIGELNGEHGSRVKHHTELSGLNKTAYGFICKLDGMTPGAREEALTCLDLYIDLMHEKKRWEAHVGDLAAQAEAASRAEGKPGDEQEDDHRTQFMKDNAAARLREAEAAEATVKTNVTAIKRGISKLPVEAVPAVH